MVVLSSCPAPIEQVLHTEENCQAQIEQENVGNGTLYIAASRVQWVGADGNGFSLEYEQISLHAVSRNFETFPEECLYVMVDGKMPGDTRMNDADDDEDNEGPSNDDDDSATTDVRFIPTNKINLDAMYKAMCDCQALHPDPEDVSDDEPDWYGEQGDGDAEDIEDDNEEDNPYQPLDGGSLEGFYTADNMPEGDIQLSVQGQATLTRLENMLAQHNTQNGDENEIMETGQFEDAAH